MCDEDYSVWLLATSDGLPTERLEFARFHHRHDRVRRRLKLHRFNSFVTTLVCSFFPSFCSVVSTILSTLEIEGFDVKALRAFRVLRPLRLVSGVPSKTSRRLKIPIIYSLFHHAYITSLYSRKKY